MFSTSLSFLSSVDEVPGTDLLTKICTSERSALNITKKNKFYDPVYEVPGTYKYE